MLCYDVQQSCLARTIAAIEYCYILEIEIMQATKIEGVPGIPCIQMGIPAHHRHVVGQIFCIPTRPVEIFIDPTVFGYFKTSKIYHCSIDKKAVRITVLGYPHCIIWIGY
jgi:hypothetical protein